MQPKQITDIRDFLQKARRKDARSVKIKKTAQVVKFKIRCSKYLYTLCVTDTEKADKLTQSLPPGTLGSAVARVDALILTALACSLRTPAQGYLECETFGVWHLIRKRGLLSFVIQLLCSVAVDSLAWVQSARGSEMTFERNAAEYFITSLARLSIPSLLLPFSHSAAEITVRLE